MFQINQKNFCDLIFFECAFTYLFLKRYVEHDDPVLDLPSSELVAFRKCQRLRLPPRLCSHITARFSSSLPLRCLAVVGCFNPRLQLVATRPSLKLFFPFKLKGQFDLLQTFPLCSSQLALGKAGRGGAGRWLPTAELLADAVNDGSCSAVTDLEFI